MYTIALLIQDQGDDVEQPDTSLHVGSLVEVVDESGLGMVGRIVSVRIRAEPRD